MSIQGHTGYTVERFRYSVGIHPNRLKWPQCVYVLNVNSQVLVFSSEKYLHFNITLCVLNEKFGPLWNET